MTEVDNFTYKNAIDLRRDIFKFYNLKCDLQLDLIRKINNDFNQSIILTTHNPDVAKLGYTRYNLKNGFLKKMS